MHSIFYVLPIFGFLQISIATVITECPGIPKPYSLSVKGCDTPPCLLYRNEDAIANITFNVLDDVDRLDVKVKAKVGMIEVPYPLPDPNTCHFLLNGYCPLEDGERIEYQLKLKVLKHYPKVSLVLTLTIEDMQGKPMTCFKLPCKVADRPK